MLTDGRIIPRLVCVGLLLVLPVLGGCDREGTPAEPGAAQPQMDEETRVRAQTLIDQAILHIKNGQFDAAETTLHELDRMSATLSEGMQRQIETARASLNAARAAPPPAATPQQQPGQ